jgi:hypothetical protein
MWGPLHTVLGMAYYRVGRYADALNSLQTAERLIPIQTSLDLAFTAMSQQQLGHPELARRVLEEFEAIAREQRMGPGIPLDERTARAARPLRLSVLSKGYSVEFLDMTGNTVGVGTLRAGAIRRPTRADRPTVRALSA